MKCRKGNNNSNRRQRHVKKKNKWRMTQQEKWLLPSRVDKSGNMSKVPKIERDRKSLFRGYKSKKKRRISKNEDGW